MSILKNWYEGALDISDDVIPRDPQLRPISRQIDEEWEALAKYIPPEERGRLEKLESLKGDSVSMYCYAEFAYGFKLGMLLMHEVMSDTDSPSPSR